MPHHPTALSSRLILLAVLSFASIQPALFAQTAVPDSNGRLVFKTNSHTVVLDIVVTGRNGEPVHGLRKEDFEVSEDGHPQGISFFEEHTSKTTPTNLPSLPPNVFTNIPRVTPTDSVTVLLLDTLNTQLQDQTRVHTEIIKYLKTMQPGRRIAIFTLGNQLRFIQGFTDDPALLAAALNNPANGSRPAGSSVLKTSGEVAAENQSTTLLAQAAGQNPKLQAALDALQQFQSEQTSSQQGEAVQMTLQAFQELANYLAGVPGRKNLIWFSSAFPLVLFPNPTLNEAFANNRTYADQVRKTDALLDAAQVAVYPVAAEGLATDSLYDIEQRAGSVISGQQAAAPQTATTAANPAQQMQQEQSMGLQSDSLNRNAAHAAIDEVGKETGGQAFYNTNGLSDAIARVSDIGSNFYTVTYTPTNVAEDGSFRKIQVKLAKKTSADISSSSFKLAYRRGYYADDARAKAAALKQASAKSAIKQTVSDPLHPYMGPGMPASTQIPFAIRVLAAPVSAPSERSSPQSGAPAYAGQNPEMAKVLGPVTRYAVDFVIAARGLQLDPAPDNGRHGVIEVTLLIYSGEGQALNWLVREVDLDMDAAKYKQVQQNGANFRLMIDSPPHGAFLRCGVYDRLSSLAGTLEVPLSSISITRPQ